MSGILKSLTTEEIATVARAGLDAKDREIAALTKRAETAEREREQRDVQLAGCSTAAVGWNSDPAIRGQYGWSQAYQDVLDLRQKYEAQLQRLAALEAVAKAAQKERERWTGRVFSEQDELWQTLDALTALQPRETEAPATDPVAQAVAERKEKSK